MKFRFKLSIAALSVGALLGFSGCVTSDVSIDLPPVSFDGLSLVEDGRADIVYRLPEADFSIYNKILLAEPRIAFRKDWKSDHNFNTRGIRVDDEDMAQMIARGKELFFEQFTKELTDAGYELVQQPGEDVLFVAAAVRDLDIYAPDPNNMAGMWRIIAAESAGSATLMIELYDSVTGQILARAVDVQKEFGDDFRMRRRSQFTNVNDARLAFSDWAQMLVKGLESARSPSE